MTTLRLVGWNKGIRSVSLVVAIKEHSTGSLSEAKRLVERLMAGDEVTLAFSDESTRHTFSVLAEELGAVIGH